MKFLPIIILFLIIPCGAGLIEEKEQLIRNASIEHAYVFQDSRLVYYTPGDNGSFWIYDVGILDNRTLLHNHPYGYGEGPSAKDMRLAAQGNVYRMIVVTHNGIWETVRPFNNYTFTAW